MWLRKTLQLIVLFGAVSAAGWLLADDDEGEHRGGRQALAAVSNAKWQAECSSCHMLYHSGLLPERSWRKLMSGLDRHFGENASLDPATQKEIATFLAKNSADHSASRRSARIAESIPPQAAPLRISETNWFRYRHGELHPDVFKRPKVGSPANCIACHKGAEKGDFSEEGVRIPR